MLAERSTDSTSFNDQISQTPKIHSSTVILSQHALQCVGCSIHRKCVQKLKMALYQKRMDSTMYYCYLWGTQLVYLWVQLSMSWSPVFVLYKGTKVKLCKLRSGKHATFMVPCKAALIYLKKKRENFFFLAQVWYKHYS